jgi:hypothetical protein
MTTCSVSSERHCTSLYVSSNGLDYALKGVILDHQNKDMLFFEGKLDGYFLALTRPLGEVYFAYPEESAFRAPPSNLRARPMRYIGASALAATMNAPRSARSGASGVGARRQFEVDPGLTAQLECLLDEVVIGKQEMIGAIDAVCDVAQCFGSNVSHL